MWASQSGKEDLVHHTTPFLVNYCLAEPSRVEWVLVLSFLLVDKGLPNTSLGSIWEEQRKA